MQRTSPPLRERTSLNLRLALRRPVDVVDVDRLWRGVAVLVVVGGVSVSVANVFSWKDGGENQKMFVSWVG